MASRVNLGQRELIRYQEAHDVPISITLLVLLKLAVIGHVCISFHVASIVGPYCRLLAYVIYGMYIILSVHSRPSSRSPLIESFILRPRRLALSSGLLFFSHLGGSKRRCAWYWLLHGLQYLLLVLKLPLLLEALEIQ